MIAWRRLDSADGVVGMAMDAPVPEGGDFVRADEIVGLPAPTGTDLRHNPEAPLRWLHGDMTGFPEIMP